MNGIKYLLIGLLVVLFSTTPIAPISANETQILAPSKDNTLIESTTGNLSNGAGELFFVGRTNQSEGSIRRGAIAFDLTKIPPNAKIEDVSLTLTVERSPRGEFPIELHRLLKDWGERESYHRGGRGDRAREGDVTWVHRFYDRELWSSMGGDFVSRISAVQTVGDAGVYTWESPEMVANVQRWVDSPNENFGWLLVGDETMARSVKGFASREAQDLLALPQLNISFHK